MRKKKPGITERRERPPKPQKIRIPVSALLRMFVLGGFSVVACLWAIWRHYTVPHVPMVQAVPSIAPAPTGETEVDLDPGP